MADAHFLFDPTNRPEERDRPREVALEATRAGATRAAALETARAARQRDIGLCLSGGGYRAMLFHAGTLLRLNDAGLLPKVGCVSSVSGGSILAAMLGLKWQKLTFDTRGVADNLLPEVITPILQLADHTIDEEAILVGAALPVVSATDVLRRVYDRHLFGGATLQDPGQPGGRSVARRHQEGGAKARPA